jgi:thioesterase domain-containing protein
LALIDTPTPHYPSFRRHWPLFAAELWRQFTLLVRGRQSREALAESWQGLWTHVRRQLGSLRKTAGPEAPPDNIRTANLRAAALYRPGDYPGRITILSAEEHLQTGSPVDRRLGWREHASGGIEVHPVPGGHFTSISEPYASYLAARFQKLIEQSLG